MPRFRHRIVSAFLLCACSLLGSSRMTRADLVGYWPLDEGSGDEVLDQSGNGLDGVVVGAPDWVEGMFGGGLEFFGGGDHVEIPDDDLLRFDVDQSFTAMAWVFIPENAGSGWQGIVTKSRDQAPWWGIWINPQNQWVYGVPANHLMLGQVEEGWHHLAISQDAEEVVQYLYLDGEVLGEFGAVDPQNGGGDLWFGGASSVSEWFVGIIDEVRVYDTALTIDELLEAMAGPDGGELIGDFDSSGALDAADIDALTAQSASGANDLAYDLNGDLAVNASDIEIWINDLRNSWLGDANLDGQFNSSDLVAVLASGTYEVNVDSIWSTGDFNGDGRTTSGDLVTALAGGGYEQGPRAAAAAIPEPTALLLAALGLGSLLARRRLTARAAGTSAPTTGG